MSAAVNERMHLPTQSLFAQRVLSRLVSEVGTAMGAYTATYSAFLLVDGAVGAAAGGAAGTVVAAHDYLFLVMDLGRKEIVVVVYS
jgi:hypothetical protein